MVAERELSDLSDDELGTGPPAVSEVGDEARVEYSRLDTGRTQRGLNGNSLLSVTSACWSVWNHCRQRKVRRIQ